MAQQKQANIKPAKNTTFELKSNFSVKLLKYAIQIYQYQLRKDINLIGELGKLGL